MTDGRNVAEWINRGKSIRQLIEELNSFEDQNLLVEMSLDAFQTSWPISLVGKSDGKCLLMNFEGVGNTDRGSVGDINHANEADAGTGDALIECSALGELPACMGRRVRISAVLMIHHGQCFLLDSAEHPISEERVEVFHPGLERTLDATLGGWVGGLASYLDAVQLEGRVNAASTRRWIASVSTLTRLSVERHGVVHVIDL